MNLNKRVVFKTSLYAIAVIAAFVLEINIFNHFKIFNAKPNLTLPLCIAVAVTENEKRGALLGLVSGFLSDLAFGSPFMMSGLLCFFAAYTAGVAAKTYFGRNIIAMSAAVFPALLVRELINLFYIIAVWDRFEIVTVALRYILPEFLYTAAVSFPIYFSVKKTIAKVDYDSYGI